jgi:hypothetical protein
MSDKKKAKQDVIDKEDCKLEKVQYLSNKNISRVYRMFTGEVKIHWLKGEPMEEWEHCKKKIILEK